MSWKPAPEPSCPQTEAVDGVETMIIPRSRDLGGFEVRRVLPAPKRQMVGPFIFFDQVGPAEFAVGQGIDVRPHPHVGLATVTYLFKGEFQHRDSLGSDQMIYPGEVNWMIAGKGITHSERTSAETRKGIHELSGIQTWVALPDEAEDVDPGFEHVGEPDLPAFEDGGTRARLILGTAYGETAPVKTFSRLFYLDVVLEPGAAVPLPDDHEDRAVFIVDGSVSIRGTEHEAGRMMTFTPDHSVSLAAGLRGARLMLLGGEPFERPRYIWWNFVASSRDRIEAAKEAWREADFTNGRFNLPVDDHDEYIPLPD